MILSPEQLAAIEALVQIGNDKMLIFFVDQNANMAAVICDACHTDDKYEPWLLDLAEHEANCADDDMIGIGGSLGEAWEDLAKRRIEHEEEMNPKFFEPEPEKRRHFTNGCCTENERRGEDAQGEGP